MPQVTASPGHPADTRRHVCIGWLLRRSVIREAEGARPDGLSPAAWALLFVFCSLPALIAALIIGFKARNESAPPPSHGVAGEPGSGPLPPVLGGGASPGQTILPGQ